MGSLDPPLKSWGYKGSSVIRIRFRVEMGRQLGPRSPDAVGLTCLGGRLA